MGWGFGGCTLGTQVGEGQPCLTSSGEESTCPAAKGLSLHATLS